MSPILLDKNNVIETMARKSGVHRVTATAVFEISKAATSEHSRNNVEGCDVRTQGVSLVNIHILLEKVALKGKEFFLLTVPSAVS